MFCLYISHKMQFTKCKMFFIQNFFHHSYPKRDLNLGLSESHRVNYEAATLTTQPPRLHESKGFLLFSILHCFVFWGKTDQCAPPPHLFLTLSKSQSSDLKILSFCNPLNHNLRFTVSHSYRSGARFTKLCYHNILY